MATAKSTPGVSFQQVADDIKKKKFRPVYFFFGDEPYFIDKLMDMLENQVLSESEKAFNLTILYGKDIENPAPVIDAARRFPMMAPFQLVLVREAQAIRDWDVLESYMKNPTATTILAFAYKKEKPDGRKSIFKTIAAQHVYFSSQPLRDWDLPGFAAKVVQELGCTMDEESVHLLVDTTGNDISRIYNEVGKMALGKPAGAAITRAEVQQYVGAIREYNTFELCEAIGRKETSRALKIAAYFKANPKSAPLPMLIGSLYAHFSRLIGAALHPRASDGELAGIIGVNPYVVKNYRAALQHYSLPALEKGIALLADYDARGKGIQNYNTSEGELIRELTLKMLMIKA